MGKLCSKTAQTPAEEVTDGDGPTSILEEKEKEIKIPEYKSDGDHFYELQEVKFNYLAKINFADYMYSLVNFSNENATLKDDYSQSNNINYSMNDPFFSEIFDKDQFQSFIENKVLEHKALYEISHENEEITTIFREGFIIMVESLGQKLAQNAKKDDNEEVDLSQIMMKRDSIGVGLLYCGGPNYIKVKTIFNIFQENQKIKSSENFSKFLLSVFLLGSYCILKARTKLAKYDKIGEIAKEDAKNLVGCAELKDSQNLVEVANKLIFGDDLSKSLSYQEFRALFEESNKKKSAGFLLSPSGIRFMLQQNNV
jgi:hypothetical protein